MKLVFITGTSSGIGLALAEELLKEKETKVVGISRRNNIKDVNYRHEVLDLAEAADVNKFQFFIPDNVTEVILINNAGWLGEVGELGSLKNQNISRLFQINVSAPIVFMNTFLRQVKASKAKGKIINISSGAANYPVKGWSNYCASKSALNMATLAFKEENPNFFIHAIAPGVVDTPMQKEIRGLNENRFEALPKFIQLHKEGTLTNPNNVAVQILDILRGKENYTETLLSLKNK